MPLWLVQVLIQYPIVVVIGFVAWLLTVKQTHLGRLKREEDNHAASVAAQREFQQRIIEAKDAEIARLRDEIRKEIEKLVKKADELNKRLGA